MEWLILYTTNIIFYTPKVIVIYSYIKHSYTFTNYTIKCNLDNEPYNNLVWLCLIKITIVQSKQLDLFDGDLSEGFL